MNNKKQQRKVSPAIFFSLLVALLVLGQCATTLAAEAPAVGIVDYQTLVQQHPDMAQAKEALQAFVNMTKSQYDAKSPSLNDNDKKALLQQIQQQINQKEQELLNGIADKIDAAIKAVAEAKGLKVVVDKGGLILGNGQDITADVLTKITGK